MDTIISTKFEVMMNADYISYESLVAARDAAKWAYWSMIGTWVAGLATFLAVLVSLYLANRRSRPVLSISIEWCFINHGYQTISGVAITVANLAETNFIITSVSWEMGNNKKLAQVFDHPLSAQMPAKLAAGESAMFFIENDTSNKWLNVLLSNIQQTNGKIHKLTACIGLASGIKRRQRAKIIIAALEEIQRNK
ncbi:TPA: hypothetical protein ACYX6I_000445 [Klebsiella variicola]